MKPNQIIMALSILGLSCSYALADNSASVYSESYNAKKLYEEELNALGLDLDLDSGGTTGEATTIYNETALSVTRVTPDTIPAEFGGVANFNIAEDENPWTPSNINTFAQKIAKTEVKNAWFSLHNNGQLNRYTQMMRTLNNYAVYPNVTLNLENYSGTYESNGIADLWSAAAIKKPLKIKINQDSAKPFFNALSKISPNKMKTINAPIILQGLTSSDLDALVTTMNKNVLLRGKLTISSDNFKQLGPKIGSKLLTNGVVGIALPSATITVKPIEHNNYQLVVYDYQGKKSKPVILTNKELNDKIITNVFKSPALKKD